MTGSGLRKVLRELYGDNFIPHATRALQVDQSTVYRWLDSKQVPGPVAAWAKAIEQKNETKTSMVRLVGRASARRGREL